MIVFVLLHIKNYKQRGVFEIYGGMKIDCIEISPNEIKTSCRQRFLNNIYLKMFGVIISM